MRWLLLFLGFALLVALATPEATKDEAARAQSDSHREAARREPTERDGSERRAHEPYDRDQWPHWIDADADCQNTRHELLIALSLAPVSFKGRRPCKVIKGLWRDAYTGELIDDPDKLDVDHVVALAEAHRSGGHAWTIERRRAFANDPFGLVLTRKSINRGKADQDPASWLPPVAELRCEYVQRWGEIKRVWGLGMDEGERVAVGRACP